MAIRRVVKWPGAEGGHACAVLSSDYDALAAELAGNVEQWRSIATTNVTAAVKAEARVKELSARNASLEAALREIAGNGRVPAVSHQFDNAQYRAGYVCGWDNQADLAKAALTPAETDSKQGD